MPVRGLPITLPFGDRLPVDTEFWSLITDTVLGTSITRESAKKFRRAGVPLRYRGHLEMTADAGDVELPRLEAHLHPFGVVAIATVDLVWPEPVKFGDEVKQRVQKLGNMPTAIVVAGQKTRSVLGQAAVTAAASLVGLLTAGGQGTSWSISPHRLVTVISGTIAKPLMAMPAKQSPLHLALHGIATDGKAHGVPGPDKVFVPQWNEAGYDWPPDSLVYMLKSGTSALFSEADTRYIREEPRTADRHRLLMLEIAYITALRGLVYAAQTDTSLYLPVWAMTAAKHLGRLYGPAELYEEWGLVPRSFMLLTDVSTNIKNISGKELEASKKYSVARYG
jgi:hypothetical protein